MSLRAAWKRRHVLALGPGHWLLLRTWELSPHLGALLARPWEQFAERGMPKWCLSAQCPGHRLVPTVELLHLTGQWPCAIQSPGSGSRCLVPSFLCHCSSGRGGLTISSLPFSPSPQSSCPRKTRPSADIVLSSFLESPALTLAYVFLSCPLFLPLYGFYGC